MQCQSEKKNNKLRLEEISIGIMTLVIYQILLHAQVML